jgi:LysR family transcriptional activator of nhaA
MSRLNYNHLYYFWCVAREGSIVKAALALNVTPQTVSGQLRALEQRLGEKLFRAVGRKLALTETGQVTLSYAEPMFRLGAELGAVLEEGTLRPTVQFRVGIAMVVPKLVAYRVLAPALRLAEPMQIICHEAAHEDLLADLALHKLDFVVTDSPLSLASSTKAYNHVLGECGLTFFASRDRARRLRQKFPQCLEGAPVLLPSPSSALRGLLDEWFAERRLTVRMVAEFDDTALMNAFGEAGAGIFALPSAIERDVQQKYRVGVIGRTDAVKECFYGISPERRLKHPAVIAIIEAARNELFAQTS